MGLPLRAGSYGLQLHLKPYFEDIQRPHDEAGYRSCQGACAGCQSSVRFAFSLERRSCRRAATFLLFLLLLMLLCSSACSPSTPLLAAPCCSAARGHLIKRYNEFRANPEAELERERRSRGAMPSASSGHSVARVPRRLPADVFEICMAQVCGGRHMQVKARPV